MKTNNKTQTNNTTTMWDTKQQTLKNKTIMKTKIEWTVDHWLAVLSDGTKKTDQHLPSLINSITGGDPDVARKIEIIF